jgi:hypothetical protein
MGDGGRSYAVALIDQLLHSEETVCAGLHGCSLRGRKQNHVVSRRTSMRTSATPHGELLIAVHN